MWSLLTSEAAISPPTKRSVRWWFHLRRVQRTAHNSPCHEVSWRGKRTNINSTVIWMGKDDGTQSQHTPADKPSLHARMRGVGHANELSSRLFDYFSTTREIHSFLSKRYFWSSLNLSSSTSSLGKKDCTTIEMFVCAGSLGEESLRDDQKKGLRKFCKSKIKVRNSEFQRGWWKPSNSMIWLADDEYLQRQILELRNCQRPSLDRSLKKLENIHAWEACPFNFSLSALLNELFLQASQFSS